jgi:hypothetical protein
LAATLAACLLSGCASEISLRAPDVNLRDARLVFMPSMVALYRIDGCDLPFDDFRSKGGRAKVDGWLRYYAAVANGRLADLAEVAGTDVSTDEFYGVMNNLTRAMFADWGKRPLNAWSLSRPLPSWATALHADDLVVVIVRGSVLTQAGQAFCHNEILSPLQRAGLVVVELATGRIVRFQAAKLADAETITEGVRKLMGALDLPPPTTK